MSTVLHLKTSLFSNEGQSSQLGQAFLAAWKLRHPGTRVITRDFAREPVPHLTAERFRAFSADPATATAEQREARAYSDSLIAELRAADVLVLGLPMYNLGIPSMLKAWFDHVARAGETFRYTADGPVGLLGGKTAFVLATRGGNYHGTPFDTQTGYVRNFLNFLGISDVRFVYAEGLATGDARRREALDSAHHDISRLAA